MRGYIVICDSFRLAFFRSEAAVRLVHSYRDRIGALPPLCDMSVELELETTQSFCCFSFTDRTISPRSLACRAADSLACSRRPALVHQASYMQRRLTLALTSPLPIALLSHTIDVVYSSSSLPPFRLYCFNELHCSFSSCFRPNNCSLIFILQFGSGAWRTAAEPTLET